MVRLLRAAVLCAILGALITGCRAREGEGISCGPMNTGASQVMRDSLAQQGSDMAATATAEAIRMIATREAVTLELEALDAEQARDLRPFLTVVFVLTVAGCAAILVWGEHRKRAAPHVEAQAKLAQAQSVEVLVNAHRCADGSADVTVRMAARGLDQEALNKPIVRLGQALSEAIATTTPIPLEEEKQIKVIEPPARPALVAETETETEGG